MLKEDADIAVIDEVKEDIIEPEMYNVIMLNDDFTPMDFVVEILETIFHKNPADAERIMLKIHNEGFSIIEAYGYDIAITKIKQVSDLSLEQNYPLKCTLEKA